MSLRRTLMLGTLLMAGCAIDSAPPRSQAMVFVDTDISSPELANRVRIEVLAVAHDGRPLECSGCSREVAIGSKTDWPISFGVQTPDTGERRLVRATLFPAGRIAAGQVLAETAVQGQVELTFGEGVLAQELFLGGACVGILAEATSTETCRDGGLAPTAPAPLRDPAAPSRVGTFRQGAHQSCSGEARTDTGLFDEDACIDGGTFWMGDVRRQGFGGNVDAVPEHLVTVSPFFLDRYEYTVARYQEALRRGFEPSAAPAGSGGACHYQGLGDSSMAAFPLNCVRPYLAEELCAFDGRRLPTEAEHEWAAGGGSEERLFPWGDRLTPEETVLDGPWPVGSHDFDVTGLVDIYDMGWNVIEWVADDFQMYTERCWLPGEYGTNPVCRTTDGDLDHGHSARGGYWKNDDDVLARYRPMAPTRQTYFHNSSPNIGFRCARDDDAAP